MDVDRYDVFIFDCDGVLWKGPSSIAGSFESLQRLHSLGKKLYFLTNNSSKTPEDLLSQLGSYGYQASPSQIYCSGISTALYLKINHPDIKKLYLIGSDQFRSMLLRYDFEIIHHLDIEPALLAAPEDITRFAENTPVDAIIVGWDVRFTYTAGALGSVYIQNGAKFIASNSDAYFPMGKGRDRPGCGAIVGFLEIATNKKAEIVAKPKTFILDMIMEESKVPKEKVVMVGDSMETDIRMAFNGGIDSVLVLSGASQREDLPRYEFSPTHIYENLGGIFN
ncbi:unnamed protein product [Blepharisma stoltei]|uniref:4-nitrophenylphosphatase n=1 Tax=Blepharisma stoltei TaxID=1481888 RepID=A0AAU9IZH2_9CILI|nr:unnamed protein product [Blepharisma stoltei]